MANSETGTSASTKLGGEYQVFLNFRGLDTRRTFTSSLYRALDDVGIRVFMDDEELPLGEKISDNLKQAIDDSKFYIPIFSKNYASSDWCLRELAKMVENTKSQDGKEKVILPIFLDVTPDDVKLKTDVYREAILKLEVEMVDQKKTDVEMWRQALREVGHMKGLELEKYSKGYGDLIDSVVHKVVVTLRTRKRHVTPDLVGMEDRIADIYNLLDIDPNGVQLIGICGMGGIGKTTLAKIIFNQLYPRFGRNCSFLDDVRGTAKTENLVKLQQKLLSDISYSKVAPSIADSDCGINTIGEKICNKKMLIVLDDVDHSDQIQKLIGVKSLYPGTIILVTTRDKSVLNIRRFKYKFEEYEMVRLSDEDALKLFCRHALNDNSPPANYYTLSEKIVYTTEELPLALELIGSSLFGVEDKKIWEERLEKLKETPHTDVFRKLRISYDALEPDHQKIFLDVACFFVGENKTNPMYMWGDCKLGPNNAIDVLTKRCMLKVLDDDRFGMHDQLRDLGRAIAKEEHSRLWDQDDIICELKRTECHCQTGESVQALRLSWEGQYPLPYQMTVTSEQIKRLPHIRFLSLYRVNCQGDFTGCFPDLKWISMRYPSSSPSSGSNTHLEATNLLHLENAVVVNLTGLQFTDDAFKSLINAARRLKVLTIHHNHSIHGTSTFPEDSVLKKLTISNSFSLMEIDSSIGKLKWMTDLKLDGCFYLRKLPEQIGELQNLRRLSLHSCHALSELPESVSKLESLTKLDVFGTKIKRLPHSIGRLPSLLFADLSWIPIVEMPSTMSEFRLLQTLNLSFCDGIQVLPKLPRSLTTLRLKSTSLLSVPDLSYLTNLVELVLSDGSERKSRSEIIQTCNLSWIESLSKLSKLYFWFPNVCAPTTELASLSLLKELTLYGLDLPTFEQIPSNLIVLELYDNRGKRVHLDGEKEIDTQGKQVHLDGLPGCNELQAPELTDHRRGAFHFPSSQKKLQKFLLSGFPEVERIQFDSTFESLEEFSVEECSSLKTLGGLSNLKNLKRLAIRSCESLQVVEGINELEYLHRLEISGCGPMERFFDASSSKIPNNCQIPVPYNRGGGGRYYSWESYREKILNGRAQATESESESEIEATDSEIGAIGATDSETQPSIWLRMAKLLEGCCRK